MSDADFSAGSVAAANAIFTWIGNVWGPTQQRAAVVAWEAGDMFGLPREPAPAPKFTREMAQASGFTGDECPRCHSLQMKRTGTCSTCQQCGETTSCS